MTDKEREEQEEMGRHLEHALLNTIKIFTDGGAGITAVTAALGLVMTHIILAAGYSKETFSLYTKGIWAMRVAFQKAHEAIERNAAPDDIEDICQQFKEDMEKYTKERGKS